MTAEGEASEDVATTPAQWFGAPGRFEIAARVGDATVGEPLVFDVGDAGRGRPPLRGRDDGRGHRDDGAGGRVRAVLERRGLGRRRRRRATSTCSSPGSATRWRCSSTTGPAASPTRRRPRGLAVGDANNVAFADYDNDGDADVMVVRDGSDLLLANDGRGRFADVSATAGIGDDDRRGMNASWADYDDDGDLDVYVTNYMHCLGAWSTAEEVISQVAYDSTRCTATTATARSATSRRTSRTTPTTTTTAPPSGPGSARRGSTTTHDGRLDLYLANDFVGPQPDYNRLWHNDGPTSDGGWAFSDVSLDTDTALFMNTMGIGVGDYDRDGDFDMALSNITANKLLRNDGAPRSPKRRKPGSDARPRRRRTTRSRGASSSATTTSTAGRTCTSRPATC